MPRVHEDEAAVSIIEVPKSFCWTLANKNWKLFGGYAFQRFAASGTCSCESSQEIAESGDRTTISS